MRGGVRELFGGHDSILLEGEFHGANTSSIYTSAFHTRTIEV